MVSIKYYPTKIFIVYKKINWIQPCFIKRQKMRAKFYNYFQSLIYDV